MSKETLLKKQQLIIKAYQAFNSRNIDALLQMMHPDVRWARAWEGDYAIGHDEVRAYWQRQWKEINPKVTPVSFYERANETLQVDVDQLVKDLDGNVLFDDRVRHIYIISNNLLQQMDVEAG